MKKIELVKQEHNVTIGDDCGDIEPNVTEDSLFIENGEVIGFYIADLAKYSEKASKLAHLANNELRSKRVPKSVMKRSSGFDNPENDVSQYSTILGSCLPKPHLGRTYATRSSVHNVESAKNFVKAMYLLCREAEEIIKELAPTIYEEQKKLIEETVPEKWRFGRLFTSSISNYNIPANFHIDHANIKGCCNVIIAKKNNATGGHTTVPDYGATVNSCDNSMLVYPAWRNIHGVTPIIPTSKDGYRNTLVFYPLAGFTDL
ncbi:MAG: hypothetical protein Tp139SUR343261_35 [Prokaryotic dsDNA virus sp.]|jgi:hypothetical protein|nr:MAG: hypothetical protein Tp139SUR343261_35 [Prokaryotic dsDNA virus sp.]|tara:strand:- start:734 stop:1513 length:780 start_codon:yes stop_codon:yes gene_type:complete